MVNRLSKAASLSALISALFGWIWIFSRVAALALIGWAIFGTGRWYYPVIVWLAGSFCKGLTREYRNQVIEFQRAAAAAAAIQQGEVIDV